jgi:hypothetical protein
MLGGKSRSLLSCNFGARVGILCRPRSHHTPRMWGLVLSIKGIPGTQPQPKPASGPRLLLRKPGKVAPSSPAATRTTRPFSFIGLTSTVYFEVRLELLERSPLLRTILVACQIEALSKRIIQHDENMTNPRGRTGSEHGASCSKGHFAPPKSTFSVSPGRSRIIF